MALTFWYEFSSTYSYLSALRIEDAAKAAHVPVVWQPFLLGPIFKASGYGGSPNLMSKEKASYMWTDAARRADQRGHPFQRPLPFPQNSVLAARAAIALPPAKRPRFSKAIFAEVFANQRDIADPAVIVQAAATADLDAEAVLANGRSSEARAALFAAVEKAQERAIFGAPTFITSDHALFWGDDRLEDALAWEASGSQPDAR